MSIPKIIHYCWFGKNPKPPFIEKCINSWRKKCPDYEIIEWNEDNFDLNQNLYCKQAYENKKWAFATDYARLWILYNYGGIYFDTDVQVIKNFDPFLKYKCFMGIENSTDAADVNTGVGIGAEKGNNVIKLLMDSYNIPFIINGKMDLTTCTVRNTNVLKKIGYVQKNEYQELEDAVVFPTEFFCPIQMETGILKKTRNTYSIHHFSLSWTTEEKRIRRKEYLKKLKIQRKIEIIKFFPNRFLYKFLGEEKYKKLKSKFKG